MPFLFIIHEYPAEIISAILLSALFSLHYSQVGYKHFLLTETTHGSLGVVHSFKADLLLVDVVLVKFSFNLGTLRDLLKNKGRENREQEKVLKREPSFIHRLYPVVSKKREVSQRG